MLNHFFFREFNGQYLLTNDFGRWMFVSSGTFQNLLKGELAPESEEERLLTERKFIFKESTPAFLAAGREELRNAKRYVFSPTPLHIFVLTTGCNLQCAYCQAHAPESSEALSMSRDTAREAAQIALSSPSSYLSFEFQGGEPLLNFDTLRFIVEYAEDHKGDKLISYSVVSNLSLLTDEMIDFFARYNVGVSTSLDGPERLHDVNRPRRGAGRSFQDVISGIKRLRSGSVSVSAIETTTRLSLSHPREIVDAYREAGFERVFLRPLTPLGYAKERWNDIGYAPEEFISFYRKALAYILKLNREGEKFMETHVALLLSKILRGRPENYMELRSPCGASVGQLAYYADGLVFTCDEARMLYEMGDDRFCLGKVEDSAYTDLVGSRVARAVCASSVLESLPECCDCVYQPYCGVCPVVNLAVEGDLIAKTAGHYRCRIYSGILDTIFQELQKEDPEILVVLNDWCS